MALTELQLPTKERFYNALQQAATQMNELMDAWKNMSEFIANVEAADLDSMGVAAGQVRTDLVNFRTVLEEMVQFYEGTPTTATNPPSDVIEKVRRM